MRVYIQRLITSAIHIGIMISVLENGRVLDTDYSIQLFDQADRRISLKGESPFYSGSEAGSLPFLPQDFLDYNDFTGSIQYQHSQDVLDYFSIEILYTGLQMYAKLPGHIGYFNMCASSCGLFRMMDVSTTQSVTSWIIHMGLIFNHSAYCFWNV